MLLENIISIIEEFAPLTLQESYDNSGLLCGTLRTEINSTLLTIDITEEVINEAINNGHNLIISHHPLIFNGIKNLIPNNYINRCIIKAIKHDICIYTAHTNIDAVCKGVSGRMCDKLGVINREILQIKNSIDTSSGFGMVGELRNPIETKDFLLSLKTIFNTEQIKHTALYKNQIRRVALCGGSGASLIKHAINKQADIYISSDFKYHDFFLAENSIILADIGHFESEQYTKEIFFDILTKKIPNFVAKFSEVTTNPISYI